MPLAAALEVLAELRGDRDVVVTTMGAAREWIRRRPHPLDFHYVPSTMSGGVPLALGLALAQPDREVTVLSGDGSLLMSLGALVTIADSGAANLTVAVIGNGVYEITGGQRIAGTGVDFAAVARACGFSNVARFSELDDFRARAKDVLSRPGPRLLELKVEPVREDYALVPPGPMQHRLERFRRALADSS
ncbi:MAG: thiamine pyrophosphate-binding protein [Candidatus Nealsonbacteria bacterium]|nr:thiamine pyrophosphate-binding protein [Candidatus Nealsonbacteria bacterium]